MTTAVAKKQKLMYAVTDAAELMGLDKNQVYVLIRTGQLDVVDAKTNPVGRPRLRVPHYAIEAFMKRRTIPAKKVA